MLSETQMSLGSPTYSGLGLRLETLVVTLGDDSTSTPGHKLTQPVGHDYIHSCVFAYLTLVG